MWRSLLEKSMPGFRSLNLAAAALAAVFVGTLGPIAAEQAPQPKAYKPVAVEPPQPVADPTFQAFRKRLVEIAVRKERVALNRLVARNFFWLAGDKNIADGSRSGIANLAQALDLDDPDSDGWDVLTAFVSEASGDPAPQRPGVICAPGDPKYDDAAAGALAKATGTTPASWFYPLRDGVEVRAGMDRNSAVIDKLGMHLVWVQPENTPAAAVHADVVRIVLPSGQFGYIPSDSLAALPGDLICYAKEGNDWKIAGVVGGSPPNR
jgi:hypothetical protein